MLKSYQLKNQQEKDLINKYSIPNGAKYFSSNGLQNYLVFVSTSDNLEYISNNSNKIESKNSIGTSSESIKNWHTLHAAFFPELIQSEYSRFSEVKIKGICLKQDSVSFLHKNVVHLYITYKIDTCSKNLNTNFVLSNCLFGAVKLR